MPRTQPPVFRFQSWIQHVRAAKAQNQTAAAAAVGVHFRTWTLWEAGRVRPGRPHMLALARWGGISVDALLRLCETPDR